MNGYSRLQIGLHWAVAIVILAAYLTGEDMGSALRAQLNGVAVATPVHVPLGLAVFGLVALRLLVRLIQGAPEPVAQDDPRLAALAVWGHRLLYVLMVLVPALGVAAWFGGIRAAGEVHEMASNLLMLTALGHAGVAIWHHAVLRDGTMMRMLRAR